MVKPNWDIFKVKFSENPQDNFEWFCYLLFCKEFKKPLGISGYKNQRHIETDPIQVGIEIVGWQAKFYDVPLSDHKKSIVDSIKGSKKDFPDLTKIIFYTNKLWSPGKKSNDPQAKIDIEKEAEKLGIKIDWDHMGNFFKSIFVSVENESISKHFFTLDKSVFDIVEAQSKHSENLLREIQTHIVFNTQNIEIDRGKDLEAIENSSGGAIILSGVGGSGKTALIKKYYEKEKDKTSIYIFKATEFDIPRLIELFKDNELQIFLDAHKEVADKVIVIDFAENLLGLKDTEAFKEFLSVMTENRWQLMFTTRDNYLEDLNYQFFEIYNIAPQNIHISILNSEEVSIIAETYSFSLPQDEKLLDLIRNPFYLREYLNFYSTDQNLNFTAFKKKLWNQVIRKNKPIREECFLKIALERSVKRQFFVKVNCDPNILDNELVKDGILGYESPYGYFITHDIYEEWALEKTIEAAFFSRENNKQFFDNIGNSLPIRRSFRNWISEKLQLSDNDIKTFIEGVIGGDETDQFWKDEILISVILSDYSEYFFQIFKDRLLGDDQKLLRKITFLLRIACKEVNADYFTQLGIKKKVSLLTLKYVLTKPRGKGWEYLIKFVYENIEKIGIQNVYFILPIVHDWNSNAKNGQTTRFSSLIALKYYQWIISEDIHFSRDDTKEKLLQTILYGSSEIKIELSEILNEIVINKWKWHRDPYFDLSETILMKLEGISVARILPNEVLSLAELFWTFTPRDRDYRPHSGLDMAEHFGMEDELSNYHPSSAYQTPIYWLLQTSLQETIDFILKFTNSRVEFFAKTEFAKYEVKEIVLNLGNGEYVKQHISTRLWCIYRNTQHAPNVLESIHMALEKIFLSYAPQMKSESLEKWLIYLLKNSSSASITAVVASIVLANPEKTFNVAKILFRSKDLFFVDTHRLLLDRGHKDMLLMLKKNYSLNSDNDLYENERLEACDDKHRTWTLENLMTHLQFFRNKEVDEIEAENRQKEIWVILDEHYSVLPEGKIETENDKTWRLYLARMDRRKMKPSTEKTKEGTIIHLNPEIEPKLKEYSEDSLKKSSAAMKYSSLKLWANYKLRNDDKYKQFNQYESNPLSSLVEVRKILKELSKRNKQSSQSEDDASFYLLNSSVPVDVCSVLIKNNFEDLSAKEKKFCKDVIFDVANIPIVSKYKYQVSDGVLSAISVFPMLLEAFPQDKKIIKTCLLIHLFNDYPVDMGGTPFSGFAISAIHTLWTNNFLDAQSILIGYLLLKSKYDALFQKMREESYKKRIYDFEEYAVRQRFIKDYKSEINNVVNNQISFDQVTEIEKIELDNLKTAFLLLPLKFHNANYKKLTLEIINAFLDKLLSDDRENRINYTVKHYLTQKYAYLLLSVEKDEVQDYLQPLLDNFNTSEAIADILNEVVSAEDQLDSFDNFWKIWQLIKPKIFELGKNGDKRWYTDKIIKSYLFAETRWKDTATQWNTLKSENKIFFKEVSVNLGKCFSTLYAIAKLLNNIGSSYLEDGISWISTMIKENYSILSDKTDINSIYYIECDIRKFIYLHREKIRKSKQLKEEVLGILGFLVEKGSVIGFLLREQIL